MRSSIRVLRARETRSVVYCNHREVTTEQEESLVSTLRKAAEEIIGNLKRAYTAPYTIVPADEPAFSHLDLSAYRRFKETLESDGYRFLSDYEILEVNNSPNSLLARTMIRCMVSADGGTSAGYYQIQPRIGRLVTNLLVGIVNLRFIAAPSFFLHNVRTKHYYDFESEIAGAYVTTSNAAGAAAMSLPASVDAKFFGYETSLTALRAAHEARLAAAVGRTGASPTRMSSKEDVVAMQARLKRLKDAHRATSNWITHEELLALSGGNIALADAIFEEVQKLLAETAMSPLDA